MTHNEIELDEESVICKSPDGLYEVRTPGFPNPCSYIRVVYHEPPKGRRKKARAWECVYWDRQEFREDGDDEPDTEALGAAMSAIKQVSEGTFEHEED